jgi:hypothetical protein
MGFGSSVAQAARPKASTSPQARGNFIMGYLSRAFMQALAMRNLLSE